MSVSWRASTLAPFGVRNFRFQWPADLLACWGIEMENIMLGWYILVETQSVLMLTFYAALQYLGTLCAPVFGMVGDRIGPRRLLCTMRAGYAAIASTIMVLAFSGLLQPAFVFVSATLMGLIRPSDLAVRSSLIGEIMPTRLLIRAMGIARTTMDSARILGALTGTTLVALLGMASAYVVVVTLYLTSLALVIASAGGNRGRRAAAARAVVPAASPWADTRDGFSHVWARPYLLAAMCIAFLCNFTAYPFMNNLMPYVAKEIYGMDQRGLGYLAASVGMGAVFGSLLLSRIGSGLRLARLILKFSLAWHVAMLVFAQTTHPAMGIPILLMAGFCQSLTMVPLATLLVRTADPRFRGRVMGIRMFAIYALPMGLLLSGPLIARIGYPLTVALYSAVGVTVTLFIGLRWREHLWDVRAPANAVSARA